MRWLDTTYRVLGFVLLSLHPLWMACYALPLAGCNPIQPTISSTQDACDSGALPPTFFSCQSQCERDRVTLGRVGLEIVGGCEE